MASRLSATAIDVPEHDVELHDEWLVPTPHGLDCRWTLRAEVVALCYYAKICGGNILEIGCNEGNTTAALAVNNPERRIYAVDWVQSPSAMVLEQRAERPEVPGKYAQGFPNVEIINADSATITYDPAWNIRMVFIDGGHHYAQVKCDSEKAIDHLQRHLGGYVLWHDYAGDRPSWVEVGQYLEREIAPFFDLRVVRDTALAVIRVEPAGEQRARTRSKIAALERECKLRNEQLIASDETIRRLRSEIAALQAQLHRWNRLRSSKLWALIRRFPVLGRAARRLIDSAAKREPSDHVAGNGGAPLHPAPPQRTPDDAGLSPLRRQILRRLRKLKGGAG